MRRLRTALVIFMAWLAALSCSNDFKDLSNPNAQLAILQLAENYLTGGNCERALEVLQPLLQAQYVNYDSRILEASAYACRGGLNFPKLAAALAQVATTDIWSAIVASNHSASNTDGHLSALVAATTSLRTTVTPAYPPGPLEASFRSADANSYMVFVSANIIGTVISPLGAANSTNGKRTRALTCAASCTVEDRCRVQVAISNIADSLAFVSAGAAIDKVSAAISTACGGAPCPSNLDYTVCTGDAVLQLQGEVLINQIESMWSI